MKVFGDKSCRSYQREVDALEKIRDAHKDQDTIKGFPRIISAIKGETQSEILMTIHGKNLRRLLGDQSEGMFTPKTVFKMTVQMVS